MTRYTSSYRDFLARLEEINTLRISARKKERSDAIKFRKEIDALCRGCIVLLSSHVEAYIKDLGETALSAIFAKKVDTSKFPAKVFYNTSKEFISDIRDTADHDRIVKRIFHFLSADAKLWTTSGPLASPVVAANFNSGFSNPSFDKVKAYFGRFGYDNFQDDFYRKLKSDAVIARNMLNNLVQCRNNIAHGDPNEKRTPQDIKDMVTVTTLFCRSADDLFSAWCRRNLCSIR